MITDEELELLLQEEEDYTNNWRDSLTEKQIDTI